MKSNKKPFYKQWWAVTIAFILVFFAGYIIGAAGASGDDETHEASVASSSKHSAKSSTTEKSSGKSNAKRILTVDYQNYEIASAKTFKPNYTNNSWAGGSVTVDKVTLYKTAKTYKYDSATTANSTFMASCSCITSLKPRRMFQSIQLKEHTATPTVSSMKQIPLKVGMAIFPRT